MSIVPGLLVHVTIYQTLKYNLNYQETKQTKYNKQESSNILTKYIPQYMIPPLCGVISEFFAVHFYIPTEIISQYVQLNKDKTETTLDIVKGIYKENGMRGFYKGTTASYLTYLPAAFFWWGSYEGSKKVTINQLNFGENLYTYGLCGVFGGITTGILSNPFDVIKVRIQSKTGNYNQDRIIPLIKQMFKHEKFWFLKGVGARISLMTIESVIMGISYELLLYFSKIN